MISKSKLFILIFLPSVFALLFGLAMMQQSNIRETEQQFKAFLKAQWQLAYMFHDDFSRLSGLDTALRVTVVSPDGTVKFDSGAIGAGSYLDRTEILHAIAGKPLMAVRYSNTMGVHMVYYAELMPDGDILRVAYPAQYYDNQESSLIRQTIWGIIALLVIILIFAYYIAYRAQRTLKALGMAVADAKEGRAEIPSFNNEDIDMALASLSVTTQELKAAYNSSNELSERLRYVLGHITEGVILVKDGCQVIYKNQRAEDILGSEIPENIAEIDDMAIIEILCKTPEASEARIEYGGRFINVSTLQGEVKLIILRDISDETAYKNYKSELVGNISHELKTPLSLILMAAETIINNEIPAGQSEKILAIIQKNAQRMNELFDDLIELSQLENLADIDDIEPISVHDVFAELPFAGNPRVRANLTDEPVSVYPVHLSSILSNLVQNALKYTQGGIDVTVGKRANVLTIEVADEGPPIPKSERKRIFERFYTVSKSRNREKGGSGLGLSIVKHIAGLYRGSIELTENKNHGNTFTVKLILG